jgi:C1A family cysteine protease
MSLKFRRNFSFLFIMKAFTLCFFVVAVVTAVNSQGVKPNHDCTCKGYEAKAATCTESEWPASLRKCDQNSDAFKNFKKACKYLNKFRDGKRNKTYKNVGNRTLTCDAWKSMKRRNKEKCGAKPTAVPTKRSLPIGTVATTQATAAAIDWTSKMTPIKNQGQCGSCWAFATDGLCEWYLKSKSATPLTPPIVSDQYLVDCNLNNGL